MAGRRVVWLALIAVSALAAGCSGAAVSADTAAGQDEAAGSARGGEVQSMVGEAQAQVPGTPQPADIIPGSVVETGEEDGQPHASAPSGGGAPGAVPGAAPDQTGAQGEGGFVVAQTYQDPDYGFEVDMPASIVVMDSTAQVLPVPVVQVHFMDEAIANSEFADVSPPELAVRVYDNPEGKTPEQWLRDEGVLQRFGAGAAIEPYTVGEIAGVRVTSMRMLAPNSAVFVAAGRAIYELQPLGLVGEQMLATFRAERVSQ
jgi:hypothetical protein